MNKKIIRATVKKVADNYENNNLFLADGNANIPCKNAIIEIINDLKKLIFPGFFCASDSYIDGTEYFVGDMLFKIGASLEQQVMLALSYKSNKSSEELKKETDRICNGFFEKIPEIQQMLIKDVQAAFDGDPAAKSKEEVIFSYPGFQAVFVYRFAHILYKENVPFIPRIMTEYAHSETGIDINSGAKIGEYFFIDHGTGVVIGETCEIGNNVKVYQGVTLGALSTRSGQQLSGIKRHPTIKDNVTIYSGSSILGGETVIGESAIIGGNSFITSSIPANTKVSIKNPELILKRPKDINKSDWEI